MQLVDVKLYLALCKMLSGIQNSICVLKRDPPYKEKIIIIYMKIIENIRTQLATNYC